MDGTGPSPDSIAYNLWQGGVIPNLQHSRILSELMSNDLIDVVSTFSDLSKARGLLQSIGTPWQPHPVYAPGEPLLRDMSGGYGGGGGGAPGGGVSSPPSGGK